jgi:hypothetical protein
MKSSWLHIPVLIQTLLLFFQTTASASEAQNLVLCEDSLQFEEFIYFRKVSYCESPKKLRRVELHFPNTNGKVGELWLFDGIDTIKKRSIFDIDGTRTSLQEFQKIESNLYHVLIRNPLDPSEIVNEEDRTLSWAPFYKDFLVRDWRYKEVNGVKKLSHIDELVTPPDGDANIRVASRTLFLNDKFWRKYEFKYADGKARDAIESFTFHDEKGERKGAFKSRESLSLESLIQTQDLSSAEQSRRLQVLQDNKREPVVVIDSGFDYSHPDLTYLMYQNPLDPVDGLDNDGDGFVDNQLGWYFDDSQKISEPNIKERVYFNRDYQPEYPFSHGTHVASIAMKGNEHFALVGFAGNFLAASYLDKISRFISLKKIRFVNMSFGFGSEKVSFVEPVARGSIYKLVQSNPETLFTIAAGNDSGRNNDEADDLPATVPSENTLIVAALDSDTIDLDQLSKYKIADFSNIGIGMVDIAAPGTDVVGANLGNDRVQSTGTSMASPKVMNAQLAVASANPRLNVAQIKELILKTAYVPSLTKPLPVRSGGILMKERAVLAAQIMLRHPNLSVAEAAWMAIKKNHYSPEDVSEEYHTALRKFWLDRKVF